MNLKNKKSVILSILINGFLPLIIYKILMNYFPNLTSLIIATIIPCIGNLYEILKDKKIDVYAMFILFGFIIGIIAVLLGGGEKFLLLRESFITGIMGMVFLISLLLKKPLIYYFAQRFSNPDKNNKIDWEKRWNIPYFRHGMKLMTLVWGLGFILEAAIKVILVYTLSISEFLLVSNFVLYGIIALLIFWQVKYVKKFKKNISEKYINNKNNFNDK